MTGGKDLLARRCLHCLQSNARILLINFVVQGEKLSELRAKTSDMARENE